MPHPQRHFELMSWPEVSQAAVRPGSTLVWPFGAVEQHGPHLPLATDAVFADCILDAVLSGLNDNDPIWRLPLQSLGFSPEHAGFHGTLSLSADLLLHLVEIVGTQLASLGFRRLVLFNAHGGQIALLQTAARQLRSRSPSLAVLPCFLWSGVAGLDQWLSSSELQGGLHAGQAETSLMLSLHPELVGEIRPIDGIHCDGSPASPPTGWSLEGAAPCAWLTTDLSSSGVIGDCSAASAEIGDSLEQVLISHWQQRFRSLLDSDWPPVTPVAGAPDGC